MVDGSIDCHELMEIPNERYIKEKIGNDFSSQNSRIYINFLDNLLTTSFETRSVRRQNAPNPRSSSRSISALGTNNAFICIDMSKQERRWPVYWKVKAARESINRISARDNTTTDELSQI